MKKVKQNERWKERREFSLFAEKIKLNPLFYHPLIFICSKHPKTSLQWSSQAPAQTPSPTPSLLHHHPLHHNYPPHHHHHHCNSLPPIPTHPTRLLSQNRCHHSTLGQLCFLFCCRTSSSSRPWSSSSSPETAHLHKHRWSRVWADG